MELKQQNKNSLPLELPVSLPKPDKQAKEIFEELDKAGRYYLIDNQQWNMEMDEFIKIIKQWDKGMRTTNGDTCPITITGRQFAIFAYYWIHCEI